MTARRVLVVGLVVAVLLLQPHEALAQCIMCRRALDSPEGRQMIAAFRSGILFLLAAPFASFGAVAFLALRMQQRRAAANTGTEPCR